MQTSVSEGLLNKSELVKYIIKPTRRRNRFFNYLLDVVVFYMILFAMSAIIGIIQLMFDLRPTVSTQPFNISYIFLQYLLIAVIFIIYYCVFEGIFGKTIGKMATNTKVVRVDGSKPTLQNILRRNFARIIPLEFLSFAFSHLPRGWHDSLSGTMVVDDIPLYNIEKSKEKIEESY